MLMILQSIKQQHKVYGLIFKIYTVHKERVQTPSHLFLTFCCYVAALCATTERENTVNVIRIKLPPQKPGLNFTTQLDKPKHAGFVIMSTSFGTFLLGGYVKSESFQLHLHYKYLEDYKYLKDYSRRLWHSLFTTD